MQQTGGERVPHNDNQDDTSGLIHTRRGTRRTTQRKQMGSVVVNGSVHTACKQHQRKDLLICVRVAWPVLCEFGLRLRPFRPLTAA